MPEIITKEGKYKFKSKPIFLGRKRINKNIAKENLILFKTILDNNNLPFQLGFGTVLGAIRENDFIEHDQDIDIIVLDVDKFINLLFDLRAIGFEVVRYNKNDLISIMRNNEYIDVYFFREHNHLIMSCYDCMYIPKEFLTKTATIKFLDIDFYVPKDYEKYLVFLYGNNWRKPIIYKLSKYEIILGYIKSFVKPYIINFIRKKYVLKNKKRIRAMYLKKINLYSRVYNLEIQI